MISKKMKIVAATITMGVIASIIALAVSFRKDNSSLAQKQTAPRSTEMPARPEFPAYEGITVHRLVKTNEKIGSGREAKMGDEVKVDYTVWIYDPGAPGNQGKKLTESEQRPLKIKIGDGRGILGLHEGVVGMREDGSRTLILPPSQSQGDHDISKRIQPNTMLLVQVKLLKVSSRR